MPSNLFYSTMTVEENKLVCLSYKIYFPRLDFFEGTSLRYGLT
jgi:hypothetical protein